MIPPFLANKLEIVKSKLEERCKKLEAECEGLRSSERALRGQLEQNSEPMKCANEQRELIKDAEARDAQRKLQEENATLREEKGQLEKVKAELVTKIWVLERAAARVQAKAKSRRQSPVQQMLVVEHRSPPEYGIHRRFPTKQSREQELRGEQGGAEGSTPVFQTTLFLPPGSITRFPGASFFCFLFRIVEGFMFGLFVFFVVLFGW